LDQGSRAINCLRARGEENFRGPVDRRGKWRERWQTASPHRLEFGIGGKKKKLPGATKGGLEGWPMKTAQRVGNVGGDRGAVSFLPPGRHCPRKEPQRRGRNAIECAPLMKRSRGMTLNEMTWPYERKWGGKGGEKAEDQYDAVTDTLGMLFRRGIPRERV